MVNLIVVHNRKSAYRFYQFEIDLADMVTLVDWTSKDPNSVFSQIESISSNSDLKTSFFGKQKGFTSEGFRHYLESFIKNYLKIENPKDYYYVDLTYWNQRPPRKLTSKFNLVSFLEVQIRGVLRVNLSSLVHYTDVGTRELGEIKDKLGIEEVHFNVASFHRGRDIDEFIKKEVDKHTRAYGFKTPPVLVYRKENEAELREALRGTDLYDELFQ